MSLILFAFCGALLTGHAAAGDGGTNGWYSSFRDASGNLPTSGVGGTTYICSNERVKGYMSSTTGPATPDNSPNGPLKCQLDGGSSCASAARSYHQAWCEADRSSTNAVGGNWPVFRACSQNCDAATASCTDWRADQGAMHPQIREGTQKVRICCEPAGPVEGGSVTATNTGGSDTYTFTLTVNAPSVAQPNIAYSQSSFVLNQGVSFSGTTPTNTGGTVPANGWSISAALPAGLTFDANSGAWSGTPTASLSATSFTVTATNSGGSDTFAFTLTVNAPSVAKPNIAYPQLSLVLSQGAGFSGTTPTNTGGTVPAGGWSISPALPAGLTFDANSGAWSGTPTASLSATSFTVTATNTGGSDTYAFTLTVNAPSVAKPNIAYSQVSYVLNQGVSFSGTTPTNTGGTVPANGWSITPALPAGLTFNANSGAWSGNPSASLSATSFTVTATNTGGSDAFAFTLTVNAPSVAKPNIAYPQVSYVLNQGVSFSGTTPTNTGGTVPAGGWSISAALPAGLTFNADSGAWSGTPTVSLSATSFTVTATNTGGSDTYAFTLTVNAPSVAKPNIAYSQSSFVLNQGVSFSGTTPTNTGGTVPVGGWSISPALPAGLTFNANSGAWSGTPTASLSATSFTVTATNSGGSDPNTFTLTVNAPSVAQPNIAYPQVSYVLNQGEAFGVVATNTGGAVPANGWSISPALPSGFTFDMNTGAWACTPAWAMESATFRVTAVNAGGSSTAILSIRVNLGTAAVHQQNGCCYATFTPKPALNATAMTMDLMNICNDRNVSDMAVETCFFPIIDTDVALSAERCRPGPH
eukprot:g1126.t1